MMEIILELLRTDDPDIFQSRLCCPIIKFTARKRCFIHSYPLTPQDYANPASDMEQYPKPVGNPDKSQTTFSKNGHVSINNSLAFISLKVFCGAKRHGNIEDICHCSVYIQDVPVNEFRIQAKETVQCASAMELLLVVIEQGGLRAE